MIKSFITDNITPPHKEYADNLQVTNRIEFVDLAKGICILLVVAFHSGICKEIHILNSLRMPLYFILSGLFFKSYGSFYSFLEKKTNKILIPFVFFAILFLIFKATISHNISIEDFTQPFFQPSLGNNPVWFLICLFWVNLIFYIIKMKCVNSLAQVIVVFLCASLGFLIASFDIYIPLFFNSALTSLPFFYAGYLLKKTPLLYGTKNNKSILLISVLVLFCLSLICIFKGPFYIDFRINEIFGPIIAIYPISIIFVISLLLICKTIVWLPIISYIGRFSIIILGLHFIAQTYLYLPLYWLTHSLLTEWQMFFFCITICWLSIPVCRRLIPFFTAQTDCIKFTKKATD